MNKGLLRWSSYMTLEELKESIRKYIEQHNETAHPYRWLYDTTPLGDYDSWAIPSKDQEPIDFSKAVKERRVRHKGRTSRVKATLLSLVAQYQHKQKIGA